MPRSRPSGRGEREATDHIASLQSQVLALDVNQRRDLAFQLAWSLPRTEVVLLSEQLSKTLQKDIIAALPPEIAVLVLGKLSLEDVLSCTSVSQTWARLCQSKELWCHMCETHHPPIRPSSTSWPDLRSHRSILYGTPGISRMRDEGGMDDSDEAESVDVIAGQGGLGGGGGIDPLPIPISSVPAVRRSVWERNSGHLFPNRILPRSQPRSSDYPKAIIPQAIISSDMGDPGPYPVVNYKHLYIIHAKLLRRMRNPHIPSPYHVEATHGEKSIRHQTLDAISSIEAGGLPGHSEIIYALELIRHRMSITMDIQESNGDSLHRIFSETESPSFSHPHPSYHSSDLTITGRNWLVSGSRDRTLRVWALDLAKPKVVKILHGGHEGSILSVFSVKLPYLQSHDDLLARQRGRDETVEKMLVVSGGSDGRICLWDVARSDGGPEHVIQAHTDSVLCVRGNQQHIVSCSKDRTIRLFSMDTLEESLVIRLGDTSGEYARAAVNAVGLSKDFIVSGSGDRTLRVWDIHTGACLARIEAHSRGIASLAFENRLPSNLSFHPRHTGMGARHRGTIITSSSDASISTFNLVSYPTDPTREDKVSFEEMIEEEQEAVERASLNEEAYSKICIEPIRSCWAPCACPPGLGRLDGKRRCGRCLHRGHMELVRSVCLTKDVIISGSYDGSVRTWDRSTGRALADLSGGHTGRVFSVVGDSCRVLSSGLDCRITLWDFGQGLDTAFVEP